METPEVEKSSSSEESSHLNRNRSFKSKQLVRSQAIRESQSPPRIASPRGPSDTQNDNTVTVIYNSDTRTLNNDNATGDTSSHVSDDRCNDGIVDNKTSEQDDCKKKQQVEIQITSGSWELDAQTDQQQRTKRWLGQKHHSSELLSNNPRVTCICGSCVTCLYCRGRRRRQACPTKQDSGIVCSDDCADCSDSEQPGSNDVRKSISLDVDEQTYCRCPDRKDKIRNFSSSRTDSDEKSEPTGAELVMFIKETLNKNARDRMTLLRIERDLHSLVNDAGRCVIRFPVMTSYGRMLVHRCASLFQLSHHIDQNNKNSVIVSKIGTSGGSIPCTSFKQWCSTVFPPSPQRLQSDITHAKSILKRDAICADADGANQALAAARSKSLEQREKEYERVRRRIFSTDNCPQDESQWPWINSGPVKLLTPDTGKNKLLKVQSLESSAPAQAWRARGAVSKSHSFGGYGGAPPQPEPQPRVLSRQGDLASSSWRLSPSSSGYKTLSLRSTDSVTPSPTGGASPEPGVTSRADGIVCCVTDMSAVPPGALVLHPQTGRPLTNADGSVYYFDPANPPILYDPNVYEQSENKNDQNNEKRRGRLEKQQSFVDNECDCQPPQECRSKCCCEYRRQETDVQKIVPEKIPTPIEQKPVKPASPCKTHQETEPQIPESNNQRPPFEAKTNQPPENINQKQNSDGSNQRYNRYELTNQRPFESQRSFDSTNQAAANQRAYEPTNQRPPNEAPVHRPGNLANQEIQQYVPASYPVYANEGVTSPPQLVQGYMQPDMTNVPAMVHTKMTPIPVQERPVSLTNMMYPTQIAHGYPYINPMNPCRLEQPLQPVYQQMIQAEEPKPMTPAAHESTFRIDPSYPYAPVEYGAQCDACLDPTGLHHQQASLNMSYGQPEAPPVLPPTYPIGNMIVPQSYPQYPEAMQWGGVPSMVGKVYLHELRPMLPYAPVCSPYNVLYPQMIPQPYPVCQPMYPVIDKQPDIRRNSVINYRQSKRNSVSGSSRNTPLPTPTEDKRVPYEEKRVEKEKERDLNRQNSNEIAQKIQQIKEQMAQINCKDKRREDFRRRNSGNGILGNYPINQVNGRFMGRPTNDETQLSSAARAIVNSIRSMQVKTTYPDRRGDYQAQYRDKPDYRRQRPDRDDKPRPETNEYSEQDRTDRRNGNPVPLQYRQPYLLRQMSPGTWCRRSPGPVHPLLNQPRRPHPDSRNGRR